MRKKILKAIRGQLLKVDWIKLEVEAYKIVQQKKRDDQLFSRLMLVGQTVKNCTAEEPHKTLVTVCDRGIFVEYMDGRMIGQRYVAPIFIDSTNWGVGKSEDPLLHVCSNNLNNAESSSSKGISNVNYAGIYTRTNSGIGPCEAEQA